MLLVWANIPGISVMLKVLLKVKMDGHFVYIFCHEI